jgi:hypothetical protein
MPTDISFCGSVGANTGGIKCDTRRGNPQKIIVGSAAFPVTGLTSASFQADLLEAVNLATGDSGKVYPFPEIVGVTNNTEANTEATLGNGVKLIMREGRPAYTFDVLIGTNLEKQLRKFNGQTVPIFLFDDNGNVWGKVNAADEFVGTDVNIFVSGAPFGDFTNPNTAKVTVSFVSARDFFDFAAFVSTDFNVNDLEGLLDATLSKVAASVGNVHKIGARVVNASLGNDVDLHDMYTTELADVDAWIGKTSAGADVIPSTVVDDAVNGGWTITFGSAVVTVNLVDPATLDTLNVPGIEGIELAV